MELDEISVEEQKPEMKETLFSDNDVLKPLPTNKIVRKEMFLVKQNVTITDFKVNRFNRPTLVVKGITDDTSGDLTITNKDFNQLLERFGSKKSDLIGKKVFVQARNFPGSKNASPGYQIEITF